jgi:guanine deaminase
MVRAKLIADPDLEDRNLRRLAEPGSQLLRFNRGRVRRHRERQGEQSDNGESTHECHRIYITSLLVPSGGYMSGIELLRGMILHTPRNPFTEEPALESYADGALAIAGGRILAIGDYAAVRASHPEAVVTDWRGSVILPGFIDAHTHFPQTRIIGGLGWPLLDWLRLHALPEEARMAGGVYARTVAGEFVRALIRNGTTTALVFGAHFGEATEALFQAASSGGIRVASGLVVSDRALPDALCLAPEEAYRTSSGLIARYHGRGGQLYAVTPRFALSTSEAMLEVCGALMREHPGVLFQTHMNESAEEIAAVRAAFPRAESYLAVYDRFGLASPRSVFAHNVHASDAELSRMAEAGSVAVHCPCSNAMLGAGIFSMRRHLAAGVRFALGTDVGAGIGFGMLKEALYSYMLQRLIPGGMPLSPAHLLYLATRAGADVMGLTDETGDFTPGKSADLVRWCPPEGTPLASAVERAEAPERVLAALLAQADEESVREVRASGMTLALPRPRD